jgi:hypothetical protein
MYFVLPALELVSTKWKHCKSPNFPQMLKRNIRRGRGAAMHIKSDFCFDNQIIFKTNKSFGKQNSNINRQKILSQICFDCTQCARKRLCSVNMLVTGLRLRRAVHWFGTLQGRKDVLWFQQQHSRPRRNKNFTPSTWRYWRLTETSAACEIFGSHGDDNSGYARQQRRWRQQASPKCLLLPTSSHGSLTQKNIIRSAECARNLIRPQNTPCQTVQCVKRHTATHVRK